MTKLPNPITQGLRTIGRDPVIFLMEVLWRWSFALLALGLLLITGIVLLGPLPIGDHWTAAWRSHDPRRIGGMVLTILLILGVKAIVAAVVAPVVIAVVWSVLSAVGRKITIGRLRAGSATLRFRTVLADDKVRAAVAGKQVTKVIVVPGKLVNVVVR